MPELTDLDIQAAICPTSLRWPDTSTIALDKLRECVGLLRGLAQVANHACTEAERDPDLNQAGVQRRREKIGRKALAELEAFKPFQLAEKAVTENLASLQQKMVQMPSQPSNLADIILATEIRAHICKQKSPIDFAVRSISDQRILSAILNAPGFLSNLNEAEWNLVHSRARQTLHPKQVEMEKHLTTALREVREGVAATKRLLLKRCEMREDEEGRAKLIKETAPT